MKAIAIIVNIFFPGVGTLIAKKNGAGAMQIILVIIAATLTATGILAIAGIPLYLVALIWSMVSVVKSDLTDAVVVKEKAEQ